MRRASTRHQNARWPSGSGCRQRHLPPTVGAALFGTVVGEIKTFVIFGPLNGNPFRAVNSSRVLVCGAGWECASKFYPSLLFKGNALHFGRDLRQVLVLAEYQTDIVFSFAGHPHDIQRDANINSFLLAHEH